MSRIHSILLTRNEADVVEACLKAAETWSDFIYVYDGASTDGTWEIVQRLANRCIVPFRSDSAVFREGLRADVFNHYRSNASNGDWWCQLNTDEFYIDDPKRFLATVTASNQVVWGAFFQYYLTHKDVEAIDFTLPFSERIQLMKYYEANLAERRFFRHRDRLVWDPANAWPKHLGVVEERLIRFKHFPYRSPDQIQTRLDVRRDNRARGFEGWSHAAELCWKEKIVEERGLQFDSGFESLEFDTRQARCHIESPVRKILQQLLHGAGVWP